MPAPSGRITDLEQPAVRVFTLGRFQVEVGGTPLRSGRKAQRRPLDLLKLLIAYRGEGVCSEQIAEDLWPDAEGDTALAALRTTISRLRKLIGADAVVSDIRGLSLNRRVCWVDALAFDRLPEQLKRGIQGSNDDQARMALEEALFLYRGTFLGGEGTLPQVLSARARLHSLFLRRLSELGECYEQTGQIERAMGLYQRGLEIDDAAEDLARKLMRCCRKVGRAAEGIAVYRRCQAALHARLGTESSPATQRVLQDLLVAPAFSAGHALLSIGVLPFYDVSPQRDYQRLADAIRETVISLLSALPQLSLITLGVPDMDDRCQLDSGSPWPEGKVRYLLRGHVLVSGRHLRAGIHLVDGRSGQPAWSEHLDCALIDVIKTHDEVAFRVAEGARGKANVRRRSATPA